VEGGGRVRVWGVTYEQEGWGMGALFPSDIGGGGVGVGGRGR